MHRGATILASAILLPAVLLACLTIAQTGDSTTDPLLSKISENQSELQQIRARIEAQKAEMAKLDERAADMKRSNEQILHDIELSRRLLGGLDERERLLESQREQLEQDLAVSSDVYEARRAALARSLRSMYYRGQNRELEMILMSGSFSEFRSRLKWEALLVRLGAGLMENTRNEGQRIQHEQTTLNVALAEIARSREEAGRERSRLEMLEAEQIGALRELEESKRGMKNQMLDLSLNEQRLKYIMDDLEQLRAEREAQESVTASSLSTLAGSLEWPVEGTLLRGFGRSVHPRFKTVTLNNGVNIAAHLGAPVASVADGKVEFVDELPGFGQCVILDHGEGYYTLYAYLDHAFVTPGTEVARGQIIAEVGRPVGAEQSQLYFEVRHGRTPLDPADWLRPR